jgi:hypothetical protein
VRGARGQIYAPTSQVEIPFSRLLPHNSKNNGRLNFGPACAGVEKEKAALTCNESGLIWLAPGFEKVAVTVTGCERDNESGVFAGMQGIILHCAIARYMLARWMLKKPPLTLREFASMGGKARKKSLSAKRRKEIAQKAGLASALKRAASKQSHKKQKISRDNMQAS